MYERLPGVEERLVEAEGYGQHDRHHDGAWQYQILDCALFLSSQEFKKKGKMGGNSGKSVLKRDKICQNLFRFQSFGRAKPIMPPPPHPTKIDHSITA